jgi:hypothetical protein
MITYTQQKQFLSYTYDKRIVLSDVMTGHRTDNVKDLMKSIIDTYNSNSHRTLDNTISNQVFKDNDDQITRHINDSVHNQQVYNTVPYDTGDKVNILEEKEKFDKGKQKFS